MIQTASAKPVCEEHRGLHVLSYYPAHDTLGQVPSMAVLYSHAGFTAAAQCQLVLVRIKAT
jgi:hypothetical protein